MPDPVTCRYCSLPIVADPDVRTPSSAWTAPDADDPTACTGTSGHAPVGRRPDPLRPGY